MERLRNKSFGVLGITVRTTNENGQSSQDIPALWARFTAEGILAKIPGKADNRLYCVYTDYEKDHTRPYTTLLGCKVSKLSVVPEGMMYREIPEGMYGMYVRYTSGGNLLQGAVFNTWQEIWKSAIDRKFTADYEVYGEKAADAANAEVAIFVAVK